MQGSLFRGAIALLLVLFIVSGCGEGGGVEQTPAAISGPPPKRPNDDLMKPAGKQKAKSNIPRTPGGPPAVLKR